MCSYCEGHSFPAVNPAPSPATVFQPWVHTCPLNLPSATMGHISPNPTRRTMPDPLPPLTCQEPSPEPPKLTSRLLAIIEHIPAYAITGPVQLARDAGVSRSSVWRVAKGDTQLSYRVIVSIAAALEKRLGRPLDPREIVSL